MDYFPPFGSADPNAPYVDRNTPGAVAGSKVPAGAIEMPQRSIVTVIKNAGLTPNKTDPTLLDQAIDQKILAITGEGGDENYVLMNQARVRLPIFAEVTTADGRLPIVSPSAGQVRIPAGYEFIHRGIFSVTTEQMDFATAANKTYHLRWSPANGFQLKDVADPTYNPGALAEESEVFDTKYDDILFCRVATSAGNVPTVKNLANKALLAVHAGVEGTNFASANLNDARADIALALDWARCPSRRSFSVTEAAATDGAVTDGDIAIYSSYPSLQSFEIPATRYKIAFTLVVDFTYRLAVALNAGD